jgi:hypothetical protein
VSAIEPGQPCGPVSGRNLSQSLDRFERDQWIAFFTKSTEQRRGIREVSVVRSENPRGLAANAWLG